MSEGIKHKFLQDYVERQAENELVDGGSTIEDFEDESTDENDIGMKLTVGFVTLFIGSCILFMLGLAGWGLYMWLGWWALISPIVIGGIVYGAYKIGDRILDSN